MELGAERCSYNRFRTARFPPFPETPINIQFTKSRRQVVRVAERVDQYLLSVGAHLWS
jgi:hypothetical protein